MILTPNLSHTVTELVYLDLGLNLNLNHNNLCVAQILSLKSMAYFFEEEKIFLAHFQRIKFNLLAISIKKAAKAEKEMSKK